MSDITPEQRARLEAKVIAALARAERMRANGFKDEYTHTLTGLDDIKIEDVAALLASHDARGERIEALERYERETGWNAMVTRYREAAAEHTRRLGYEPGHLQAKWRGLGDPSEYPRQDFPREEAFAALMDALCEMGSVPAWHGDGTSCAEQIIAYQLERAERALAQSPSAPQRTAALTPTPETENG